MKQTIRRVIISGASVALLAAPAAAFAHDGDSTISNSGSGSNDHVVTASTTPAPSKTPRAERVEHFEQELKTQLEQQKTERQAVVQDNKAELKQKLDDAKKRVCENHQAQINRLITGMNTRRQNAFNRITQVSEAVQSYYGSHSLSVANYDDLLAAVVAAKAAASTSMTAQQAVPQLNCEGEHPRADVADFKGKRSDSIDAMKAYRTAVKALVKAVKEATDTAKTSTEGGE